MLIEEIKVMRSSRHKYSKRSYSAGTIYLVLESNNRQFLYFKHRQVRYKKKHILPPQAATSPVFALLRRGKQVQWSDSGMERLHKQVGTVF